MRGILGRTEIKRGNKATHTVWFIGLSYTHTKYVHKHKYSNVQIYTGLTDHPLDSHPAPANRCPYLGSSLG